MKARRKYVGINKRQKYEYQCNQCKNWFPDKSINVDHIVPVGNLNCSDDLSGFVDRLFVEIDGLQVLCSECHNTKTKEEKDGRRQEGSKK
jgi:5-methylcytosine-specific restriction endonuclease McrA